MEEKQFKLMYSENYQDIILQEIADLYDIDNKDYICSKFCFTKYGKWKLGKSTWLV